MTENNRWDLSSCVERILAFRDARDWKRFHTPKDLAAALAIEAGELQEVFLWKPPLAGAEVKADPELTSRAKEEIADCAIFLLLLAQTLDIDLRAAIDDKVTANDKRYKAAEHRGKAQKAPHGGTRQG